ncbi:hypothetical protein EDD21DRAFT_349130 [Dissophora ornata]|nr:hypothetical protein EDD21DRAFT_349130 [Dissophora ornata]
MDQSRFGTVLHRSVWKGFPTIPSFSPHAPPSKKRLDSSFFRNRLLNASETVLENDVQLVEAAFGRIKVFGGAARTVVDEPFALKATNMMMMPLVFVETFKSRSLSSWPLLTKNALPEQLIDIVFHGGKAESNKIIEKHSWDAKKARDAEFPIITDRLLKLSYFVQKARSPGYIVVGINEYYTSKKCPSCHNFVCEVNPEEREESEVVGQAAEEHMATATGHMTPDHGEARHAAAEHGEGEHTAEDNDISEQEELLNSIAHTTHTISEWRIEGEYVD